MNGRMNAILDRLISVKLWTAIVGEAMVIFYGDDLDPALKASALAAIPIALMLAQGFVDAMKGQRPTS